MHVCRGQILMLDVFLHCSSLYSLRQGASQNWNLQVRPGWTENSRNLLSPPSQNWDIRSTLLLVPFMWVLEIWTQVLSSGRANTKNVKITEPSPQHGLELTILLVVRWRPRDHSAWPKFELRVCVKLTSDCLETSNVCMHSQSNLECIHITGSS